MAKIRPEQGPTYMVQSITLCLIYHADTFTHLARVLNHSACSTQPDAFHAHLAEGLRAQFPDYPCSIQPTEEPTGQQLLYLLARSYASYAAYIKAPMLGTAEAWCLVNVILTWLYTAALLLPPLRRRLSLRLQLGYMAANLINDLFTPAICWCLVPSLPPTFMRHYTPVLCEALGYTAFVGLPPRFVYFVCTIVTLSLGMATALLIQHGLVDQVPYRLPSLWVRQVTTLVAVVAFTALRGRIWRRFMTPGGMSPVPCSTAVPWLLEGQETAAIPPRSPPNAKQLMYRSRQAWYFWLSWRAMVAVPSGLREGNAGLDTSPQRGDSERKARLDPGRASGVAQNRAETGRTEALEQLSNEAAMVREIAATAANRVADDITREQVPFQQWQQQCWHQHSTSSPIKDWFSLDEQNTAERSIRSDANGGGGGTSPGEGLLLGRIVQSGSGARSAFSGRCKGAQVSWQRAGYGCEDEGGSSGIGDGGCEGQLADGSDCFRFGSLGGGDGHHHQRMHLPPALLQPAVHLETQPLQSYRVTPPRCKVQPEGLTQQAAGPQPALSLRQHNTYLSSEQRHPSCSQQLRAVPHMLQLQVGPHRSGSSKKSTAAAAAAAATKSVDATDDASPSCSGDSAVDCSNMALSPGSPPGAKETPVTVGELRAMVAAARAAPYCSDASVHFTRVHLRLPGVKAAELSPVWREEVLLRLSRTLPTDYTVVGLAAFNSSSSSTQAADGVTGANGFTWNETVPRKQADHATTVGDAQVHDELKAERKHATSEQQQQQQD